MSEPQPSAEIDTSDLVICRQPCEVVQANADAVRVVGVHILPCDKALDGSLVSWDANRPSSHTWLIDRCRLERAVQHRGVDTTNIVPFVN